MCIVTHNKVKPHWANQLMCMKEIPCMRLAGGKFELTNQERYWNQVTSLTGDGIKYPRRGIYNFKNQTSWQKVKNMNHFEFLRFYFGAKNGPRHIKPGILKLTTSRGQRNLRTIFIFVSCEEKGCYRIVSLGHQNFDCRSYCGLSRRMQGSE